MLAVLALLCLIVKYLSLSGIFHRIEVTTGTPPFESLHICINTQKKNKFYFAGCNDNLFENNLPCFKSINSTGTPTRRWARP
jgi:hypothetical protein